MGIEMEIESYWSLLHSAQKCIGVGKKRPLFDYENRGQATFWISLNYVVHLVCLV
jgi:hypothetical protein